MIPKLFQKSSEKIICLIITVLLMSLTATAQEATLYYDIKWQPTVIDSAAFFRPPVKKEGEGYRVKDYYISGEVQMSGISTSADTDVWLGKVIWYSADGSILQQGNYKNGRLEGEYSSTLKGKKLMAVFQNGRMVSGKSNGKLNERQYYTEIKGDTTINIIYEKNLDGVRYERYSVGKKYDVLVKYFNEDGAFIGQRESLPDGKFKGIEVSYYQKPMRVQEIKYFTNGTQLGSTFYYCEGQVREEFKQDPEFFKTFYNPKGEVLSTVNYVYANSYLKPVDGREYTYYSSYTDYKGELVRAIRDYENSKLLKEEYFYENQNLKSRAEYDNGKKQLQISYNEKGGEIARMTYDNWAPKNGTEIIGDREITYANGKLVAELNYYYTTKILFSRKTLTAETYYDKNGAILGTLSLKDDNGYSKAMNGERYHIDYEGDIQSIEVYKDGFITERTSYRKRQIGEKESVAFKKLEMYEPNSYKKTKTISFYSNGNKQSEISYTGYAETKGVFYDDQEKEIGVYDYVTKEGTLYEFFGDSDKLKRMEVREDGKQVRLKRYDYGLNAPFGQINPVLVEDVDVNCCAMFYTREGQLLGKVTFKDGIPWDGKYYDQSKRTRYTLKEGKRNGLYEKLDYDQRILEKGNFVDNNEEGLFSYFNYGGQLIKTENYKSGSLEGVANFYEPNGELLWKMTYKAGVPFNGTRVTTPGYNNKPETETYQNSLLIKRISFDDNGKRITHYNEGVETQSTAYYGETDTKRLSFMSKNNRLHGTVIRYDEQGREQYKAVFENGKLKDGTVLITGGNVRGNPAYIVLSRKADTLGVKLMGLNDKVLFKAEENLAFGVATVFMQSLDIYMEHLGPERLY